MRRRLLHVGPVVERDGTIRPYPKSPAGERPVPVDDDVWPRLRDRAMAVPRSGLLFVAARGGVLSYSAWYKRTWSRALRGGGKPAARPAQWTPQRLGEWLDEHKARAGYATDRELARAAGIDPSMISNWRAGRHRPRPEALERIAAALQATASGLRLVAGLGERRGAGLPDPQPTPHDLRHTYGTRLGEQGVPPHEITALMGHEDLESVQRYLHAGNDRFGRARAAMRAARRSS